MSKIVNSVNENVENIDVLALIGQVAEELNNGLPFMNGREKQELPINEVIHITDFGFLTDGKEEYVCFITKEDKKHFYFGGQVLTDRMKAIEEKYTEQQVQALLAHGIEIILGKKKGGNGFVYTTVTLFPSLVKKEQPLK